MRQIEAGTSLKNDGDDAGEQCDRDQQPEITQMVIVIPPDPTAIMARAADSSMTSGGLSGGMGDLRPTDGAAGIGYSLRTHRGCP